MLIIDAHAHLYAEDERAYPPAENPARPPASRGAFAALRELAGKNSISGICAVQTYSFYRWDNRYLCSLSRAHRSWLAGVCLLDPDDAASPEQLACYANERGIRGLRSYAASDGRLDHPGVRALWKKADDLGIVVNVSVGVELAADVAAMAACFPHVPVVIDHCLLNNSRLDVSAVIEPIVRLSQYSNVNAKLSFLPIASAEDYPYRDMHAPCRRIIAEYGPERCLWGNSFPTELWSSRSTYSQNLRLFTEELEFSEKEKACILGGTANRLWFNGRLKPCTNGEGR